MLNRAARAEAVHAPCHRILPALAGVARSITQQQVGHAAVGVIHHHNLDRRIVARLHVRGELHRRAIEERVRPAHMLGQLATLRQRCLLYTSVVVSVIRGVVAGGCSDRAHPCVSLS